MAQYSHIIGKGSIDMTHIAWEAPAVLRQRGEIQPDMMFRIRNVAEGSIIDCLDIVRTAPCAQRDAFAIRLKADGCELHATDIAAMLAFIDMREHGQRRRAG